MHLHGFIKLHHLIKTLNSLQISYLGEGKKKFFKEFPFEVI